MALYQATTQQVEELTKSTGTGYPSIDRPWLSYYTKEAIEDPLPQMSLFDYLYENNKYNLDSDALNYMGNKISFRELFKRIDEAAKAFLAQGVQEGDIVSILTVACVPCVISFYALNKIGAVVDFINVLSTAKDLVKFFRANKSKVVVSADIFMNKALLAAKAIGVEHVISFSMEDDLPFLKKVGTLFQSNPDVDESYLQDKVVLTWDKFIATGAHVPDITYIKNPNTPALLAHTGGTTGFPKAVMLSDNAMNAVAFQYHYIFRVEPKENVFLNLVVPFVVYGSLINMHMPLTMRSTVVLIPNFDAEDWPEYFNKYKPNFITAIPNYIAPMLNNPRMRNVNLECLKVIAVGGEGAGNALEVDMNRFLKRHGSKAKLLKGYGMTELSASACTGFGDVNALGSVGVPLPRNQVQIVNPDTGMECKYNEIGEICFRGPGMMLGYKDNPEEMKSLFRKHSDGTYWVHTGDLGYMNRKGLLYIVGRIKRAILTQYKGTAYRIYPNVIEEVLISHPAVREACVVKLHEDRRGRTKAYIALNDHNRVDEEEIERELRSFCDAEMAEYMRPFLYEFRGSLPLTPAGKVDYKLLEIQTAGQR
ncbi:MAG: acyl--CoA ligase [Clostridia bacterium]|nr:acyl--CoA ligase [Clostridia bacterium]